jgi:hypothetical protein
MGRAFRPYVYLSTAIGLFWFVIGAGLLGSGDRGWGVYLVFVAGTLMIASGIVDHMLRGPRGGPDG